MLLAQDGSIRVQLGVLRREEIVLSILAAVFPLRTWAPSRSGAEAGARRSSCSQTGANLIDTTA